jgi:hypothetical protein
MQAEGGNMEIDVLLCDHAEVAGNKLFINGANINQVNFPAGSPAPYLVTFAAAGIIHIPWTQTNKGHELKFQLITEDGNNPEFPEGFPVSPDGVTGNMKFNVGRPAELTVGEEQIIPFAFNFQGLPLMNAGRYELSFSIDGTTLKSAKLSLVLITT